MSRFPKSVVTTCLFLSVLFCSVAMAREEPSKKAKDLVTMINSMIGTWVGDVEYYDKKSDSMKKATAEHVISGTPIESVFTIHAKFFPEEGSTKERYEVMGVRGDGDVIRMIDLAEYNQHVKSETVLDYSMNNPNDWTMTFLEQVEADGEAWSGPALRKVHFVFSGDAFTIKKSSLQETGREFDLFANVKRQ